MLTYAIGETIRSMRVRAGYTQEELSFGICAVSTLSRIENGKENVSKRIFEALMSKMLEKNLFLISCESREEMECAKLYHKILFLLEQRKLSDAKKCVREYEELIDKGHNFYMQFVLFVGTVTKAISRDEHGGIIEELYQALYLTLPNAENLFQSNGKRQVLLSYNEIFILNHIGVQYAKQKEYMRAFNLFSNLQRYMEQKERDILDVTAVKAMILSNLAGVLEEMGQFPDAARLCDTGIEACRKTGRHTVLPYLLCTKARCLAALGKHETSKNCKVQAKTILDIGGNYKGYGDFIGFYEAKEPIYVTL